MHSHLRRGLRLLAVLAVLVPMLASAATWWNPEFKQRTQITINTSAVGVELREGVSGAAIPVRLHSGNFDFLAAKPDGSDLRFVAGDDKTPLKFAVERFDGAAELAVVWVQVPLVVPGSDKNVIYAYSGNEKASAEAPSAVFDASTAAAFHFAEKDGIATDHTGALKATNAVSFEPNGLIGPSARLSGSAIEWPASERVRAAAGTPFSLSLWVRPESASGVLYVQGALSLALEGGKLALRLGSLSLVGGDLPTAAWAHVGLALGNGKAILYVNGAQATQADLPAAAPAIEGPIKVGQGLSGQVDELQLSTSLRSAEWMKFTRAVQGADAKLVAAVIQTRDSADSAAGDAGYIGVLVRSLTLDAKVVIGILGIMFAIAVYVMVTKALFVRRTDGENRRFVERFRSAQNVLEVEGAKVHPNATLARLYDAGLRELTKRDIGKNGKALSGPSMDAVKAAIDADVVRENQRLNAQMVLLTIAISGGPFLGLLGTVVGVMITFAAIAAAGDVNVNAIAPGIAAALLATVAGLGVAIPALFGYNYLASRIKNISADMQIFVDEFVTRVAETYGAR
jgi:biopolymer transport protein ExbB